VNIYIKKQIWKFILALLAAIIVSTSLWYSSRIAGRIADGERMRVQLWVKAIQKRESLMRYTNEVFEKLAREERKKVELWASATKELSKELSDYTFALKVVADNTTVPVILTDDKDHILSHRNLDSAEIQDTASLREQLNLMKQVHPPIEIEVYKGRKQYLYYKDSRLFTELKRMTDDFVQSFISEVIINAASVPVIFTDNKKNNIVAFGNIDSSIINDKTKVARLIAVMQNQNAPIEVHLREGDTHYIFYNNSYLLTQLKFFPLVQFIIIALFILLGYWMFSISRKAEQNQVWLGMARETAHQLGTPLSSLMAWFELMKERNNNDPIMITELEKDIKRLSTITERFSKIGSAPDLKTYDLVKVITNTVNYIKLRTSDKIIFKIIPNQDEISVRLNVPLFEWVIENLLKNSIDATGGIGRIEIQITDQIQLVYVDISDTGKGIPQSKHKTVFEPGYTTKQRGWGLGLSLAKRIIETYHYGKIFVKRSEPAKGTTFRIVLKK